MQVACYRYYLSYSLETYLFRDKEMLCYKNPIFILPGLAAALLLSYYLLASLSRSLVVSVIKDSNFPTYLPPYIRNIVLRKPRLDCIKLQISGHQVVSSWVSAAHCELYLALTALVIRVYPHLQLYETSIEDVRYYYDIIVPMAKKGS